MATVPPPLPRSQVAELSLTDEGKEELALIEAERSAIMDREWPKPTLGDVLDARQRWQDDSALWRQYVLDVRRNRYAQDTTPPKWHEKLNIPDDRRFRTNLTANEILRVSAVMGRNPPKVTLRPDGSTDKAIQRAEKQASWGQALGPALERNNAPLWAKGDDAAAENGQGYYELYMTDAWKATEKLIDDRDPGRHGRDCHHVERR